MTIETLLFKELSIFPELFLGISLICLLIHGTFLTVNNNYPLIQMSILYLSTLILFMVCFLLLNNKINVVDYSIMNNTITNDYLGEFSKCLIGFISIICLLMIKSYLIDQKLNQFEYVLLLLFSVLGVFLLCSSNDLITAYLAIELQSLSFYVLAAFKKNSTFSVEAGLKYFILGAFSSSLFLFGSSIIYGITGTMNFDDLKDLFFWLIPGSMANLSDIDNYYLQQNNTVILSAMAQKLFSFQNPQLTENDFKIIIDEFNNFNDDCVSFDQIKAYACLSYQILTTASDYNDQLPFQELTSDQIDYTKKVLLLSDMYTDHFLSLNDLKKADCNLFFNCYFFFLIVLEKIHLLVNINDIQDTSIFYNNPFDLSLIKFALIFILISLFFKLALAPFHLWSPDVYEGSPSSSTFFFAVIPKFGIFVLLIRVFYYGFYNFIDSWRYYVVIIAILSIIVGSFVGLEQRKLKSLLAYSSISHMGYSLVAFSTGSFEGLQILFCYLIIYISSGLAVWSIFILTRLKNNYLEKQNKDLTDFVLLAKANKMLAFFLAIVLFSIAGFPPLIGFIVKLGVFLVSVESSMYLVALVSILCSVVSTFYYLRIIKIMFFEKNLVGKLYYPIKTQTAIIVVILFYFYIFLFINPTVLYLFTYKLGCLLML